MPLALTLLALTSGLPAIASPEPRSAIHPPQSLSVAGAISADLLGFTSTQEAIVEFRQRDGSVLVRALALPTGPLRTAERIEVARAGSISGARDLSDLEIGVSVLRALGDRPRASIVASAGGAELELASIAASIEPIRAGPLWPAPDGRHAILAIDRGAARSLEVLDLRRARAALYNLAALGAWTRGDRAAAERGFASALAVDAGYGDAVYNLACVHSVGGDLGRAVGELKRALAIDPRRYRRLARVDPDLAAIRSDSGVRAMLGLGR